MNYQDRNKTLTVEQLRQRYNLDGLAKDRKAISNNTLGLTRIEVEQDSILKSIIINLGDILESQSDISLWFFNGIPTSDTEPTVNFRDYSEHEGDIYYDKESGYVYIFQLVDDEYSWIRNTDASLIQAMALSNSTIDTNDNLRKVFLDIPIPPYDCGDWYIKDGDLYICQISKPNSEKYNENDFIIASKYTDDTRANELAGKLTIVSGQVTTIIKNLDLISQTIEDNRYYIDKSGEKHLIASSFSKLIQTVNELNSKISDVADITISGESIYATVSLDHINQSEPIQLIVHPTKEQDISYLYPSNYLYTSDRLFPIGRTIRFKNITTNEIFDYEIPKDLLYYDENNYDELRLNYDSQTCYIIKKVKHTDRNGINELLETPQTIECEYPKIQLTDGDYTISLLGYDKGYIFCQLMSANIYTTQFATKAEMNSEITQKSNEIDLKLVAKLDGKNFTGANIMLQINNDKSNAYINADKISLKGKEIKLTGDNISISSNNFNVDRFGNIKCKNAELSGRFINYDGNGNKAIEISNQNIYFYDWKGSGKTVGMLSSTRGIDTNKPGIDLYANPGNQISIGYKISDDDSTIYPFIRFDTNNLNGTPWIINTASGKMFPEVGEGVTVENGLIKNWNLDGASGTMFKSVGGIKVRNGIITEWTLPQGDNYLYLLGANGQEKIKLHILDGLITDWSVI